MRVCKAPTSTHPPPRHPDEAKRPGSQEALTARATQGLQTPSLRQDRPERSVQGGANGSAARTGLVAPALRLSPQALRAAPERRRAREPGAPRGGCAFAGAERVRPGRSLEREGAGPGRRPCPRPRPAPTTPPPSPPPCGRKPATHPDAGGDTTAPRGRRPLGGGDFRSRPLCSGGVIATCRLRGAARVGAVAGARGGGGGRPGPPDPRTPPLGRRGLKLKTSGRGRELPALGSARPTAPGATACSWPCGSSRGRGSPRRQPAPRVGAGVALGPAGRGRGRLGREVPRPRPHLRGRRATLRTAPRPDSGGRATGQRAEAGEGRPRRASATALGAAPGAREAFVGRARRSPLGRLAALLLQERSSVSRVSRRVRSAGPRAAFPSERGFLLAAGPETPSNARALSLLPGWLLGDRWSPRPWEGRSPASSPALNVRFRPVRGAKSSILVSVTKSVTGHLQACGCC
ncbi:translation initiation factor IF-2-like [Lutra lutra]|uniref:translation initiation factor IF-2-like n=1 Tax=Lutra lutra TaxID=9657 RepID=UPI001FD4E078|nr:translation initiation factor IF-2-like [Lutra lutra]